ncbi:MAG: hypothetical protein CMB59_00645 [Euryarchaeota archaeon]|nr:hypothetical protein [Euryarchaeota archaeon]|tara:strand:- start:2488 stop:3105 length:618 start_codon:yes stop_codon:yes gene_type:complete
MKKHWLRMVMGKVKSILSAVVGLLLLGSLIGYSGQEIIPDVPKPDAGLCGVTKEAFDTVPGASALLDIEVEVSWDDNTVWIGIISVGDYNSLEKLGGNSEGEIVSCDSRIEFIAGGPSSGSDSKFDWIPDGEEFHIMIGSLEDAEEEDDEDDDDPWPFSSQKNSQSFIDEFNVTVNYDVSGGWGAILVLFAIEITLVYFTLLDKS